VVLSELDDDVVDAVDDVVELDELVVVVQAFGYASGHPKRNIRLSTSSEPPRVEVS
jgi:hypothetical protein